MIHSALNVGVIGLNHKTASLLFREEMAKGASALSGEKALFFPYPTVLLSTCNRTEIYFSAENLAEAHSDLLLFLRRYIETPFEHRLYSYFGLDCFAHLCRVAAGLDSAILAETEIQRQVKVAYERAAEYARLPASLHYIFQKGLKVGKEIRSQGAMSLGAPTLANAIWELAKGFLQGTRKQILFVGYSEMNRALISYFYRKKIEGLTLCTRNPAAVRSPCRSVDRSELHRWVEYDLILCASSSERYLVEGESKRAHFIFDLSVPRNVDPRLGHAANIRLYNIEELNQIIDQKQQAQSRDFERSEEFVWEKAVQLAHLYSENRLRLTNLSSQI